MFMVDFVIFFFCFGIGYEKKKTPRSISKRESFHPKAVVDDRWVKAQHTLKA